MNGQLAAALGVVIGLAAVALLAIAGLGATRYVDTRRAARVHAEIGPVLRTALSGGLRPAARPVRRSDAVHALAAWLDHRAAVTSARPLVDAARELGLAEHARRLLRSPSGRARVTAAIALGHLGDRRDVPALLRAARRRREPLATAALASLVRLDEPAAFPLLDARLRSGPQPLPPLVAAAAAALPDGRLSDVLRREAERRAVDRPGLLRLAALRRDRHALAVVRAVLACDEVPTETLAAALQAIGDLGDPTDASLAARHLAHDSWIVRVRATRAVARLGGRRAGALVVPLLEDPDPWVRRRAAEAVVDDPVVVAGAGWLSLAATAALAEASAAVAARGAGR